MPLPNYVKLFRIANAQPTGGYLYAIAFEAISRLSYPKGVRMSVMNVWPPVTVEPCLPNTRSRRREPFAILPGDTTRSKRVIRGTGGLEPSLVESFRTGAGSIESTARILPFWWRAARPPPAIDTGGPRFGPTRVLAHPAPPLDFVCRRSTGWAANSRSSVRTYQTHVYSGDAAFCRDSKFRHRSGIAARKYLQPSPSAVLRSHCGLSGRVATRD